MKSNNVVAILLVWLVFISCSKDNTAELNITNGNKTISTHFNFVLYDGLDEQVLIPIISRLEDNYERILNDLAVSLMEKVTVKIWNNESNFQAAMKNDIGQNFWGATGYIYSPSDIRVLNRGDAAQIALHEFCHAVSIIVKSNIGNNPRWFWEAVAIYEAKEFIHPKTISYLAQGDFPTLAELNSNYNDGNQKIYQVGYIISEYIIQNWDKHKFIDLIKTNGNIPSVLGITSLEFEHGWKEFVLKKYF